MTNPKYQVFRSDKNGEFYFRLNARNGEIILASEGYTSKQGCLNGIESVRKNAPDIANYQLNDSPDNYSFNLRAQNHEIIGRSESYTTAAARNNGVEAVMRVAPDAPVEILD